MPDRLKGLERELGLPAVPAPFPMDAKAISRRVEATLSARPKERKLYMRHKVRLAAVLTAAAVALTGTALAVAPALSEALQKALGEFAPYAHAMEGTAVDQGIQVKVVSALADGTNVRVYAELTDLTGNRLEHAVIQSMDSYLKLDSTGGSEGSGWAFGSEKLGCDPETKTLLYAFDRYNGALMADGTAGTLYIDTIRGGYTDFETEEALPQNLLTAQLLKTRVLPSGETVLTPGQTPAELPGAEGVSLSSMGFAADGRLHILFRLPEGADPEKSSLLTNVYSKAWREGDGGDQTYNRDWKRVGITENGKAYYEFSVPAKPENLDDIILTPIYGSMEYTGTRIEGDWQVPVTIRKAEERVISLTGTIDHSTLQSMVLSPLGVTLVTTSPDFTGVGGYPLAVYLADGTVLRPQRGFTGPSGVDGPDLARWDFREPVDLDQITGVSLGYWMIPLANGGAGEGYWLSRLPE